MEIVKGYCSQINERFSVHIAEDNEDVLKALVDFNMKVHQEEVLKTFIPYIFLEHPRRNEILWLYIKDKDKNKIASSMCLVPSDWQIKDTILPVCEMEFVGTLEKYRGEGLMKVLNELYEKIMDQKGYILSTIRGIPYFYRSLGYEYVSSLDERINFPVSKIPHKKYKKITIRKALSKDIPFIKSKYTQFHKKFYIFNKFDPDCFAFKYLREEFNSEVRSTYIFEQVGVVTNYFTLGMSYDNQHYEISNPDLSKQEMITLLQFVKNIGNYNEDDMITLSISMHSSLFKYIKSLGGKPSLAYAWQVKIPELKKFFFFIKKIFENRIKNSEFKELSKILRVSNFRETIELTFSLGKIENIEIKKEYPDPHNTDLRIPGALLFKLLLGDRSIEEINYIIKDTIVNLSSKKLIKTIFPKKKSYLSSYI